MNVFLAVSESDVKNLANALKLCVSIRNDRLVGSRNAVLGCFLHCRIEFPEKQLLPFCPLRVASRLCKRFAKRLRR
ncbi:hypothetical protein BH18ACT12_BH18ACT12_18110 [soil metagenome]